MEYHAWFYGENSMFAQYGWRFFIIENLGAERNNMAKHTFHSLNMQAMPQKISYTMRLQRSIKSIIQFELHRILHIRPTMQFVWFDL